jgi:hypothetical protein
MADEITVMDRHQYGAFKFIQRLFKFLAAGDYSSVSFSLDFLESNFLKGLNKKANADTNTSPKAMPICEIIPNNPGSIYPIVIL